MNDEQSPVLVTDVSVDPGETDRDALTVEVSIAVPDALYEAARREAAYGRSVNGYALPVEQYLLDRITLVPQFTAAGDPLDES